MRPVGQPGDGNTQDGVHQREGQARHKAQLGVGQVELSLDGFLEDRHQLPVKKVTGVDHRQKRGDEIAIGGGAAAVMARV
jgi:hypothetical protein